MGWSMERKIDTSNGEVLLIPNLRILEFRNSVTYFILQDSLPKLALLKNMSHSSYTKRCSPAIFLHLEIFDSKCNFSFLFYAFLLLLVLLTWRRRDLMQSK